jgi:sulfatase modifying factor 1
MIMFRSILLLHLTCSTLTSLLHAGDPTDGPKSIVPKNFENVMDSQHPSMVSIAGKRFRLGDITKEGEPDEVPVSYITVKDFYMSKCEITVAQFEQFVSETQYVTDAEKDGWSLTWDGTMWSKDFMANYRNPGFVQTKNDPVVCVSWNDAVAFCEWMSEKTRTTVRLPMEAEWEYAAREQGMRPKFGWGNGDPSGNVADETAASSLKNLKIWNGYTDGFVYTAPVGSFRPNALGLFDMSGNVLEWCVDSYGPYTVDEKFYPPIKKDSEFKVLRGGSWFNAEQKIRATARTRLNHSYRSTRIGFRIVQEK